MKEPAGPPEHDDAASRDARTFEGWISAFQCSTDFEADLVRDRLDEEGIAAVVFTQRDHSFNLNVGDLASVHVMVRAEDETAARTMLAQPIMSDADLEAAAMAADVMAPDAHTPADEAALDSGIESISLDVPDEDDDVGEAPADDLPRVTVVSDDDPAPDLRQDLR